MNKKSILSLGVMSLLIGTTSTNAFAAHSARNPQQTYGTATTYSTYSGNYIQTTCNYTQWDINNKPYSTPKTLSTSGPRENTVYVGNQINGARKTSVQGTHKVYGGERFSEVKTSYWYR